MHPMARSRSGRKRRPIDEQAPQVLVRNQVVGAVMTEFYAYAGRADVWRFGEHVDARVQSYTLVPYVAQLPES